MVDLEQEMMDEQPETQVIEIHPDARYAVLINERITADEHYRIRQQLDDWWKSDEPFIVIAGYGIKLIRVDE